MSPSFGSADTGWDALEPEREGQERTGHESGGFGDGGNSATDLEETDLVATRDGSFQHVSERLCSARFLLSQRQQYRRENGNKVLG
jgi:hypothetical protein